MDLTKRCPSLGNHELDERKVQIPQQFGDGMLDLKSTVHFEEKKLVRVCLV